MTIDEVRKLLESMPRKTLPLDVLPVSLLKDTAEVFAVRTGHHHTRKLVTADQEVPSMLHIDSLQGA